MNAPEEKKEMFLKWVQDMPDELYHTVKITPNRVEDFHGRYLDLIGCTIEIGITKKVQSTYPIGYKPATP